MSPRDLANRIGMGQSQLSDIERGIQTMSLRRACQMAGVFEASIQEMLEQLVTEKLEDAGFTNFRVEIIMYEERPSDIEDK
jgi:transcriptional regulator with XRE-family HTH domain